ncbi:hypothetical protein [Streptomyces chilikensis]|uniref:hypothetical protein n=1 Tax=Streptomyces chilikensis TaxID=1194079 RepID=UPI000AD6061F|nr:hypothetical protein [Streptomyces chilikensis]
MTPGHTHLRETVEAYLIRHPAERDALAGLLAAPGPPEPIVPYAREAVTGIAQGRAYTELGWEEQT